MTGNAGLIATEFLLRYYALAGRLMTEEAGPRLEPAIAADALQQYVDQFTHVRELSGGWWSESLTLFDQGGLRC